MKGQAEIVQDLTKQVKRFIEQKRYKDRMRKVNVNATFKKERERKKKARLKKLRNTSKVRKVKKMQKLCKLSAI